MDELRLTRPLLEHRQQYEAMMDEWEGFGGRLNPGALRRCTHDGQKVRYEKWLEWIEEDRKGGQELFFLMKGSLILGAISIRNTCAGVNGHSGFGIRPSERNKGYATRMLAMALPIMKDQGIDPVVISCARDNIGSAKTIQNNGGRFIEEARDDGEIVKIYHIEQQKADGIF